MRILFDQGTPVPLRNSLVGHEIVTAHECGWGTLQNGDLLRAAENAGFEAIITTDQNLRYQQNLSARRLAIIVLLTTNWPIMRRHISVIGETVTRITAGAYIEIAIPPPDISQQE